LEVFKVVLMVTAVMKVVLMVTAVMKANEDEIVFNLLRRSPVRFENSDLSPMMPLLTDC
jgi:hypothetical protein